MATHNVTVARLRTTHEDESFGIYFNHLLLVVKLALSYVSPRHRRAGRSITAKRAQGICDSSAQIMQKQMRPSSSLRIGD
eukprot:scaffold156258_cov33-Tisochrysis_lutea.AAC.4